MTQFEISFPLPSSQYNEVLVLEKYGDNYGIVLAQESRAVQGTNYRRWVYPQRRVDGGNRPAEKAIPMRIPLGSRAEARQILKSMLAALNANDDTLTPDTPAPASQPAASRINRPAAVGGDPEIPF